MQDGMRNAEAERRQSIREEDVEWRQAGRQQEGIWRRQEMRRATRRSAIVAASNVVAKGASVQEICNLAEQFVAWIDKSGPGK